MNRKKLRGAGYPLKAKEKAKKNCYLPIVVAKTKIIKVFNTQFVGINLH